MSFPLLKNFEKVPLQPVMVLCGPDTFLLRKAQSILVSRALEKSMRDMNLGNFQGGEDDLAKALSACRDFPCFAQYRVVVLTQAGHIRKKETADLIAYLEAPISSTIFILEDEKFDGRLDWVKVLKKRAQWIEIPSPKSEDCLQWLRESFQERRKKPEALVLEQILQWVGSSLAALEQTAEQLSLYVGEREAIRLNDVEALLSKVSHDNVFAMIDQLFLGEKAKFYVSLKALLEAGEAPLKILSLLYRHLSILLSLAGGNSETNLLKLPPFVRRQYETQAQRFGKKLRLSLLAPLAEADVALKSSSHSGEQVLHHCVGEVLDLLA